MSEGPFAGQRICIVGGTAGIGLAIARRLAQADAAVVIAGRDAERTCRIAGETGANVEGRTADIMDEASIAALFEELGPIDHLVITAAQVRSGLFREGAIGDARLSVEGKFWSQYLCVHYAQVRRSVLLFSGTLSRKPMPGTSIIGAINGAIDALGRSLAVELAPLRVNVISPGLIQGTDAYSAMPDDVRAGMMQQAAGRLPAGIVGDADSVAGIACAVLASPYVTGALFDIDGGGLLV